MINVKIVMYDRRKYEKEVLVTNEIEYKNVRSYKTVGGAEGVEIGLQTDDNSRDDFNEYIVLTFEDGTTATFRNSYCDLFKVIF